MAVGHDFSSSIKIGNLTSLNLDLDIIRSLKGCGYLKGQCQLQCIARSNNAQTITLAE
jgi:hypothetical protein